MKLNLAIAALTLHAGAALAAPSAANAGADIVARRDLARSLQACLHDCRQYSKSSKEKEACEQGCNIAYQHATAEEVGFSQEEAVEISNMSAKEREALKKRLLIEMGKPGWK